MQNNNPTNQIIGIIDIILSFYDPYDEICIGSKIIKATNDLELNNLRPLIQHELNHIHKNKNILTSDYLREYNKLIKLQGKQNKQQYITDLSNIIYYCIPNEMGAFVEQFYKEYQKKKQIRNRTTRFFYI